MWVIMLVCWVPLSAVDPQAFGGLVHSFAPPNPFPDLSKMTVSVTLAHSWDSGCLLPWADIPHPLALAHRRPAQISWPSFLLCMEGPGLEQRLRGWNGDRRERKGENQGAHLKRCFLSLLPLFSFSPYYQSVWCQTCPIWGERRDTRCRQILKVAADYFKRRKCRLPLWGLRLIRLSAAGVKRGNTSPFLWKKYKQFMYLSGHPPSARPLWNNLPQQPFLLHLSACIASPWLPLSCSSVQPRSCSSECTKNLWCLNESVHSSRGLAGRPLPTSNRSSFSDSWWGQELSYTSKEKRFGMRIKLRCRLKPVLQDKSKTECAQQDGGSLRLSTEDLGPPGLSRLMTDWISPHSSTLTLALQTFTLWGRVYWKASM